jgi:hypothetical protein
MGLTLHDIFSHQAVVRLRGSEIVARVIEESKPAALPEPIAAEAVPVPSAEGVKS